MEFIFIKRLQRGRWPYKFRIWFDGRDHRQMFASCARGMQEQQIMIEELKAINQQLISRIEALEKKE